MTPQPSEFAQAITDLIAVAERHGYDQASLLTWLLSPSSYVEDDGIPASLAMTRPREMPLLAERVFGVEW